MRITQFKTQDAGRRVQGFLDSQVATIGTAVSPGLRAELDAAVAALTAFQREQGTSSGTAIGETSSQAALRHDLFDRFMRPIGKVAKNKLAGNADLSQLLVPAFALNTGRVGDFMSAADRMADAATTYEQVLVQGGMAPDFLAQFKAAIAAVDASMQSRFGHFGRRVAATAGLEAKDKAVRVSIDTIDSMLRSVLKSDPSLQAQWASCKKIAKTVVTPNPTGSPATDPEPSTPTPTPTPAPSSAPAPVAPAPTGAATPALSIADGTKAAA